MAKTVALSAQLREAAGKGAARRERREGRIPAVIYGDKQEPVSISFERVEFERKLDSHFFTHLFEITVGETVHTVVARDLQMDPVRDFPIHVDLLRVTGDAVVTINVPVEFLNADKAPGLKRGGVLNVVRHDVEVYCLADNIPEKIVVDLAGRQIGDSIHISAVTLPQGVRPTIDRDFTIATIAAPTVATEASEAETGAAEAAEA